MYINLKLLTNLSILSIMEPSYQQDLRNYGRENKQELHGLSFCFLFPYKDLIY